MNPPNLNKLAEEVYWKEVVPHMNVETYHAYNCNLKKEYEHIEKALLHIQEATREETIKECAGIAENHDHEKYCSLEKCGGYSGTSKTCDMTIPFEINGKILSLLKSPTPVTDKEKE